MNKKIHYVKFDENFKNYRTICGIFLPFCSAQFATVFKNEVTCSNCQRLLEYYHQKYWYVRLFNFFFK